MDKYYKGMGANACEKIESVALDGARSYIGSTRKNGVNAVVVYDKFHVIQKLNGTVDMVRKRELRKARKEENTDLIELTNCKQRHISVCG